MSCIWTTEVQQVVPPPAQDCRWFYFTSCTPPDQPKFVPAIDFLVKPYIRNLSCPIQLEVCLSLVLFLPTRHLLNYFLQFICSAFVCQPRPCVRYLLTMRFVFVASSPFSRQALSFFCLFLVCFYPSPPSLFYSALPLSLSHSFPPKFKGVCVAWLLLHFSALLLPPYNGSHKLPIHIHRLTVYVIQSLLPSLLCLCRQTQYINYLTHPNIFDS